MTVNIQEESVLERDVTIFKAQLTGLSRATLSARYELSPARIEQIANKLVQDIVSYLKEHSLPIPTAFGKVDRVKDSAFWSAALDQYLEELKNKPKVLITDPVEKIGITENLAAKLNTIEVINVGDLLEALATKRNKISRFLGGNITAMDSLERKIRQAGFDPNGGKAQLQNNEQGK